MSFWLTEVFLSHGTGTSNNGAFTSIPLEVTRVSTSSTRPSHAAHIMDMRTVGGGGREVVVVGAMVSLCISLEQKGKISLLSRHNLFFLNHVLINQIITRVQRARTRRRMAGCTWCTVIISRQGGWSERKKNIEAEIL